METNNQQIAFEDSYASTSFEGLANIGKLHIYAEDMLKVPDKLMKVYMGIGRRSLGYLRPTTDITKDLNRLNHNTSKWAASLGISVTKFKDSIRDLTKLGYIKVHKGSHYREGGGMFANYYSIVLDYELMSKYCINFTVMDITPTDEWIEHCKSGRCQNHPTQQQFDKYLADKGLN